LGVFDDGVTKRRDSDDLLLKLADSSSRTAGVDDDLKLGVADDGMEKRGGPDAVPGVGKGVKKRGVSDTVRLALDAIPSSTDGVGEGVKKRGVSDTVRLALDAIPSSTDGVDDGLKVEVDVDGVKHGVPDTVLLALGEPAPNKNGVDDGVVKRSVLDAVLLGTGELRLDSDWPSTRKSGENMRSSPKADAVEDGVKSAVLEWELIDPAGSVPCSWF
jgi:hypothetical protein